MRFVKAYWSLGLTVLVIGLAAHALSQHERIVRMARSAFEKQMHVHSSTVIGMRRGGACSVVVLRTADGRRAGVAVVRGPGWEVIGLSLKLQLRDFVDGTT